ncbi:MAG: HAMP domain-containing protein [Anaerolineales bacterium]|nr:MAG: HAMP domain-containing protein [Anaerolineales bacterium]
MTKAALHRWLRSLHAQLILWAVLPITFFVVALAFTGIYTHQQEMQTFVADRNLALAQLSARSLEDSLAHGTVAREGSDLAVWAAQMVIGDAGQILVVDSEGRALVHPDAERIGSYVGDVPAVVAALQEREGVVVVSGGDDGETLAAFAAVNGTDWVVLVQEPVEGLIGPILRFSSLAPVVGLGAGLLSVLVLVFGWLTIIRPLQRLSRSAEQVSWGDHTAINEPVGGVQEVRDLHRALADMVERIRGYESGMRDYLGAVTRGQEAERARLARELHDGPVQDLIALAQRAEIAHRLVGRRETKRLWVELEETRRAALATVDELRRQIGALRPVYLDDLGFLPALKVLVQQASERTSADVTLEERGAARRFAPEIELAAYRIAQEALTNAVQHSQAEHIAVQVGCDGDALTLSVADDGVGFDLPRTPNVLTQSNHFGLIGMHERATRLGGRLQIRTGANEGTRVTVHLADKRPD